MRIIVMHKTNLVFSSTHIRQDWNGTPFSWNFLYTIFYVYVCLHVVLTLGDWAIRPCRNIFSKRQGVEICDEWCLRPRSGAVGPSAKPVICRAMPWFVRLEKMNVDLVMNLFCCFFNVISGSTSPLHGCVHKEKWYNLCFRSRQRKASRLWSVQTCVNKGHHQTCRESHASASTSQALKHVRSCWKMPSEGWTIFAHCWSWRRNMFEHKLGPCVNLESIVDATCMHQKTCRSQNFWTIWVDLIISLIIANWLGDAFQNLTGFHRAVSKTAPVQNHWRTPTYVQFALECVGVFNTDISLKRFCSTHR